MASFRSDNNAGICPEALEAVREASGAGHATGYGADPFTEEADAAFRRLFGEGIAVFYVATGTAANTLSIAALSEPWQRVLCHVHSHWNDDESTAPELFTGCRTATIRPAGEDVSKLTPADVETASVSSRGDVHQPQPGVLTLSNPTEFGTVYTAEEMRALCGEAHEKGYRVHVDGARFANAVAHLMEIHGASAEDAARSITVDAGVDALSFGGTKNGLALGEAAVFFPREGDDRNVALAQRRFPFLRKRSGHLLSKHRFVSAPFAATLRDHAWIGHAAHANAMARRIADGLHDAGRKPRFDTQSNGVFVSLPGADHDALWARGHEYYLFGEPDWSMARLMCSFDTAAQDVDALLTDLASLA